MKRMSLYSAMFTAIMAATPLVAGAQVFSGTDQNTGVVLPGAGTPNTNTARNAMLAAIGATPFTTNNFEALAVGSGTTNLGGGITATYTNFNSAFTGIQNVSYSELGFNTTVAGSKFLQLGPASTSASTLTLNFATAINFFGGYFTGVENACGTVTATWGASSGVFPSSNSSSTCDGTAGMGWYGFVAPTTDSFTSITFTEVGNAAAERWDIFGMDDIIYGARSAPTVTPEPSSYALMFAGLGVIAAAARRRKRNA